MNNRERVPAILSYEDDYDRLPRPDHRIPPDAKWENVQYDFDMMRPDVLVKRLWIIRLRGWIDHRPGPT